MGSNQPIPIDIRLICATNCNLPEMVVQNLFREDLLYRVNTIHIEIPPLRERKEDIIPLAERFIERFGRQYDRGKMAFSLQAIRKLKEHPKSRNKFAYKVQRAARCKEQNRDHRRFFRVLLGLKYHSFKIPFLKT